jgi:hypothetical protein
MPVFKRVILSTLLSTFFIPCAFADTPRVELVIENHKFIPEELPVPANTKVELVVKNRDATSEEFESYELNREKVIAGGSEGSVFIGPLEVGEYPFFGEFNPETAQGKIVVR